MRGLAVHFYTELFAEISPQQKEMLDSDITLQEVTVAVQQLSTGRAPGIDGLPADFYKNFWD